MTQSINDVLDKIISPISRGMSFLNKDRPALVDLEVQPPLHFLMVKILQRIRQESMPALWFWVQENIKGTDQPIKIYLDWSEQIHRGRYLYYTYPTISKVSDIFLVLKHIEQEARVPLPLLYFDVIHILTKFGDFHKQ